MQLKHSITGAREIGRNLLNVGRGMATSGSDEALIKAADMVVADAKRLVPVRTGALKRAIARDEPKPVPVLRRSIDVGVKPPVSRRAHFTEFGTAHNSAHPFLRPALDAQSRPAVGIMGRALRAFMDRVTRGIK